MTQRSSLYASGSQGTRPWLLTPKPKTVVVAPKTMVHPRFKEYAQIYAHDPLYCDIFNKAAYGKFPHGFGYKDGHMLGKQNRKSMRYCKLSTNPVCGAQQCVDFMQSGGIVSELNISDVIQAEHDAPRETVETEMKKRIKLRDEILRFYIHNHMKHKYNLTQSEEMRLLHLILSGFVRDRLSCDDIELVGDTVVVKHLYGLDEDFFVANRIWRINPALQVRRARKKSSRPSRSIRV